MPSHWKTIQARTSTHGRAKLIAAQLGVALGEAVPLSEVVDVAVRWLDATLGEELDDAEWLRLRWEQLRGSR